MRIASERGITLIEIMIAVSLLGMLSAGVLLAMRIGFTTLEKTDERLIHNRRVINTRQIIENEILGFMLTPADWRPKPEVVQRALFFEFAEDRMRFVTSYSLQDAWRGRPQIAEFQVIPGEHNQGLRLIVNETPYTGPAQTGLRITSVDPEPHFAPISPGPGSFVLADKLKYCRFSYYQTKPPSLLPLGIRIEMDTGDVIVPLTATPEPNGFSDTY